MQVGDAEARQRHIGVARQLAREPFNVDDDAGGKAGCARLFVGIAGLPPVVASLAPASWNQIASWLKQIDDLRQAA